MATLLNGMTVPITGDNTVDAMTNGYKWDLTSNRVVNWSISNGWNGEYWSDTNTAISTLSQIFSTYSYYANIKFNYLGNFSWPLSANNSGSDINLAFDSINITGAFSNNNAWGYSHFPNPSDPGRGDIYFNLNALKYFPSYAPGSEAYAVAIHEIGHALGLKHPHDDGGTGRPTFSSVGIFNTDYMTVMSYNDSYPLNMFSWSPATPMALDVIALQYLYGKNNNTNTGDSIYTLTRSNLYLTIWDASGNDTIDQSSSNEGWFINLPNTQVSNLVDTKVGFGIPLSDWNNQYQSAPTSLAWLTGDIENVKGSNFTDTIYGS